MANVVVDPKDHPDAIIPDLSIPDPLVTFGKADIAFVYGSRWKQRYFAKSGDTYYPLPAQWDVTNKKWKPYHVPDTADWWVPFYGKDNKDRPTGPLCDGCHSVNYDVKTKHVTEWNVGCERCHGPGADHVKAPTKANIANPDKLDQTAANDVCIQCHSQGRPLTNPIAGNYYDWPVGYRVGLALNQFWALEPHEPGTQTFTHFPDGTAHKNRMQGNDFVQSVMYQHGIRCFDCHDVHGSPNQGQVVEQGNALCLRCHELGGTNGPKAATLEQHTHHSPGSPGSQCAACHMPPIEETLGDVKVRSHTFKFIPPGSAIPNACVLCHADKPASWAVETMRAQTSSP